MAMDASSHTAETAAFLMQWARGLGYAGVVSLPRNDVTKTLLEHVRQAGRTEPAMPASFIESAMRRVSPEMVAEWLRGQKSCEA